MALGLTLQPPGGALCAGARLDHGEAQDPGFHCHTHQGQKLNMCDKILYLFFFLCLCLVLYHKNSVQAEADDCVVAMVNI